MKIALYYRHIDDNDRPALDQLTATLCGKGIDTVTIHDGDTLAPCDFLFSIGGDGTLLSTVQFVRPDRPGDFPPVLGINFGHLGFLTTVGKENLYTMVEELLEGRFTLEERTLLQLHTTHSPLPTPHSPLPTPHSPLPTPHSPLPTPHSPLPTTHSPLPTPRYALNEVFVHRTEEASLLRTELHVDGRYVATYAGDGAIVATPTGSTAYSLSCGGPILTPDSRGLLITPISAHTLTLRPVIVPDTVELHLRVGDDCFLGCDSSRTTLAGGSELTLRRAPFTIRLVRLGSQNFFTAIREKLMWGTEIRL